MCLHLYLTAEVLGCCFNFFFHIMLYFLSSSPVPVIKHGNNTMLPPLYSTVRRVFTGCKGRLLSLNVFAKCNMIFYLFYFRRNVFFYRNYVTAENDSIFSQHLRRVSCLSLWVDAYIFHQNMVTFGPYTSSISSTNMMEIVTKDGPAFWRSIVLPAISVGFFVFPHYVMLGSVVFEVLP